MNETVAQRRKDLLDRLGMIGPCLMPSTNVYCPRRRQPDSAAGLCGPCMQRQEIRDELDALPKGMVVWIGSYGLRDMQEKSYEVVRQTVESCMQAMQNHHLKYSDEQLEFVQVGTDLPTDHTGYAEGEYRWEADVSRRMADGKWSNEWVYIEPFWVPEE